MRTTGGKAIVLLHRMKSIPDLHEKKTERRAAVFE